MNERIEHRKAMTKKYREANYAEWYFNSITRNNQGDVKE